MNTARSPSIRYRFAQTTAILLGALALYVFSIGPVTFYFWATADLSFGSAGDVDQLKKREDKLFFIYTPLTNGFQGTAFEEYLGRYCGWWYEKGRRQNPAE
jgi:hypothetical protein